MPLTIILFRAGGKERYILPVISMENIAAVRGSLLTPFGSPQNLFIYGQSGVSVWRFISYMFPIWVISGVLLVGFVAFLYRKNIRQKTDIENFQFIGEWQRWRRGRRIAYLVIFVLVITTIVTRTGWWFVVVPAVAAAVFFIDRQVLALTDYVLLLTFFCFFIFSSSIARGDIVVSEQRGGKPRIPLEYPAQPGDFQRSRGDRTISFRRQPRRTALRTGFSRTLHADRLPCVGHQLPSVRQGLSRERQKVHSGLYINKSCFLRDSRGSGLFNQPVAAVVFQSSVYLPRYR